jgi:hypothetical protein
MMGLGCEYGPIFLAAFEPLLVFNVWATYSLGHLRLLRPIWDCNFNKYNFNNCVFEITIKFGKTC